MVGCLHPVCCDSADCNSAGAIGDGMHHAEDSGRGIHPKQPLYPLGVCAPLQPHAETEGAGQAVEDSDPPGMATNIQSRGTLAGSVDKG